MANVKISDLTDLAEAPVVGDLLVLVDVSDTTDSVDGTTKQNKAQYGLGCQVNAQTGTTYTVLVTDFRKLVTHTNGSAIAVTLPQAGASFPAGWFYITQNRGAGAVTITPTASTIDGAASLVLNQHEGAIIFSDGTNYFTFRGKATGAGGVGDVVGPGSSTDNALVRFDLTTGKLVQNSTVTLDDTGAFTVPEMSAPSTPASGKVAIYAKSDGKLYIKDDAGTETDLTGTAPSGSAGGDLSGTYPNPTVIKTSLTAAHGSDDTWTGTTIAGLNAGATIAQWEVVYLDGSSTWQLADANGTGTYPARGLATAAYVSTNPAVILVHGTVRNDAWSWTPGGTIYLSGSVGALTQTAPSTSGDKVQQVGFALTADIAFFDFNNTYLTVT